MTIRAFEVAVVVVPITVLIVAAVACGSSDVNKSSEAADASVGADSEGGVKPPDGCDATKEPKDSPKCVSSDFGIFVSPNGTAGGTGKMDSPVNTIAAGLAKTGAIRRLYICDGTYPEHVVLKSAVSLYGGFKCDTWAHDDAIKPVVGKTTESGYGLDVQSVNGAFDISDLEFGAGNGDDASPNSIAARFVDTSRAVLRRIKLAARDGFLGKNGILGIAGSTVNHTDLAGAPNYDPTGNAGASTTSGAPRGCRCPNATAPDDQTIGGGGSLTAASPASPGTPTLPASAGDDGAAGALHATNCGLGGGTGHNGAPRAQAAGGVVATRLGTLTDGTWKPEPGANGATALPGQGGGGGSGQSTGAGSGGGCGGCGGFGGKTGTGGGATIALLTVDSPIHISGELRAGHGGRGGDGGGGGDGGPGGTGGVHVVGGGNGCPGGDGGKGGTAGAGSGGAGGLSVGILTSGAGPITDGATFALGAFGDGGTGLSNNSGPPGIKANSASVENVSTKTTM